MDFWKDILYPALTGIVQDILGILPKLFGSFIILVLGWLVAKSLDAVVRKILERVGFNKLR